MISAGARVRLSASPRSTSIWSIRCFPLMAAPVHGPLFIDCEADSAHCAPMKPVPVFISALLAAAFLSAPARAGDDWADAPPPPGDWSYRSEAARRMGGFGLPETEYQLMLLSERGSKARRRVLSGRRVSVRVDLGGSRCT